MVDTSTCVLETYPGASVKRKRSLSEDEYFSWTFDLHESKKHKNLGALITPISPLDIKHNNMANEIDPISRSNLIANTIESQFSLEILLKHKELRLIDQELAKCQVDLEQLRRCHLIAHPGNLESPEATPHNGNKSCPFYQDKDSATWALPFGDTDGPCSRQDSKLLIRDPGFEGMAWKNINTLVPDKNMPIAHSVRRNDIHNIAREGKTGLRGKSSQKHQALSLERNQTKDRIGPCIVKRGDGKTVKLVCLDCDRENFLSAQGFINHCRIAHQRDFKSHIEAANASGQYMKVNETNGLIRNHKDPEIISDLVHPLIRNAPTGKEAKEACKTLLARLADSKAMLQNGKLPGFSSLPNSESPHSSLSKHLFSSSSKPYLSDLLHRKGLPHNLDNIVEELYQQIDIEELPAEEESTDSERSGANIETQTGDSYEFKKSSLTRISMPTHKDLSLSSRARDKSAEHIKGVKKLEGTLPKTSSCYSALDLVSQYETPTNSPCQLLTTSDPQSEHITELNLVKYSHSSIDLSPHTAKIYNAPSPVSDGEFNDML
ncbi:putative e3 ubiquitin-protein ligase hula [Erysiphe necator]|uniref:Putative e3 ubiquitin-protein ligase hula n=1 Tax=Uncinula necator TaxID=52586 RepID=A0A0B1P8K2_UNCNE|nr:putative e3 ubiquitin-protein ligase hula [Erysiphe necator]